MMNYWVTEVELRSFVFQALYGSERSDFRPGCFAVWERIRFQTGWGPETQLCPIVQRNHHTDWPPAQQWHSARGEVRQWPPLSMITNFENVTSIYWISL
jgi:hypothetical protein